jgi:hypothetical protein
MPSLLLAALLAAVLAAILATCSGRTQHAPIPAHSFANGYKMLARPTGLSFSLTNDVCV